MIKGVEVKDGNIRIFADVIQEILGCKCSALSGANIANEGELVSAHTVGNLADTSVSSVAEGKFSETTIGYREGDLESAEIFFKVFDTPLFKVGLVEDVAGVSLCGALKNVVAIAAGFTDGLGWGSNAKGELSLVADEESCDSSLRHSTSCRHANRSDGDEALL
jgi:glycerol-3-phosphate dehydrogenase (NAD+)